MSEDIFVGTKGPHNARIMVVGEAYGANEEYQKKPFVGASGKELDRMLAEAGINPQECFFTNIVNKRPPNNEMTAFFIKTKEARSAGLTPIRGLYPDVPILEGLDNLHRAISAVNPDCIIGFGNYPLWALTEQSFSITDGKKSSTGYKVPSGITAWRGSQLTISTEQREISFVPTIHPAAILRNWAWRRSVVHDFNCRVKAPLGKLVKEPFRNYLIQPSFDAAMDCIQQLLMRAELSASPILLAADVETLGGFLECIGLAWSRSDAICIPIMSMDNPEGYWSAAEEVAILTELGKLLQHTNVEVVGQNFIYDYQYFWKYMNVRVNYIHDTMLAHHVLWPGTPAGLGYLSSMYCDYHCYWKEDGKEANRKQDNQQRWIYNCRDCVVTYEVIEELWKLIKYYNQEEQYAIQMVRARAILDVMLRGVRVDNKKRAEEWSRHMEVMSEYGAEFNQIMPKSIWTQPPKQSVWYNSTHQLQAIFYEQLGEKPIYDHKTGSRTLNDAALNKIGARTILLRDFCRRLREYRTIKAFEQFLNMDLSSDGRMRTSFSPTAETFRYRSGEDAFGSGRNAQNLPKGKEDD